MKIIVMFFLMSIVLLSQTREPSQHPFSYTDTSGIYHNEYLSADSSYFKLNQFMVGFHWGGSRVMSRVLKANQADIGTNWGVNVNDYNNGTNLFVRSSWENSSYNTLYSHCVYDNQIIFTKSLRYSAALYVDSNNPEVLHKLPNVLTS